MASKYILYEVGEGQYRFRLVSPRGQEVLTSSLFTDKDTARRKIDTTSSLLRSSKNFQLLTAQDGGLYFTVVTRKGETLAYSATFPDAEGRQAAMGLAKGSSRGARFEDLTLSAVSKPEQPVASDRFAARRERKPAVAEPEGA